MKLKVEVLSFSRVRPPSSWTLSIIIQKGGINRWSWRTSLLLPMVLAACLPVIVTEPSMLSLVVCVCVCVLCGCVGVLCCVPTREVGGLMPRGSKMMMWTWSHPLFLSLSLFIHHPHLLLFLSSPSPSHALGLFCALIHPFSTSPSFVSRTFVPLSSRSLTSSTVEFLCALPILHTHILHPSVHLALFFHNSTIVLASAIAPLEHSYS